MRFQTQMGNLHFLIYFSLLFFLFLTPIHVHGNAELEALMEIKSSLDPENMILSSWTKDKDPCEGSFQGVACNEHHKVANISLQGKGLSGKVSPALAELKCLSGLYLHFNNLSGEIPIEISNLTELTDLYLNVNSLSGNIPSQIGTMASLQVLQLCFNQLSGKIPSEIGQLKRLSVIALQHNNLSGQIPSSLSNLGELKRVDLSFNNLNGTIPMKLASIQSLQNLDVSNNSLFGFVPQGFRRLKEGFQSENNPLLCGVGFSRLRPCTTFDYGKVNVDGELGPTRSNTDNTDEASNPSLNPESANIQPRCSNQNQTHCSKSTRFSEAAVVSVVVVTVTVSMIAMIVIMIVRYRRRRQKIGAACESSVGRLSSDQCKEFRSKSASPLVSLEYSNGWESLGDGLIHGSSDSININIFRFNMEEIETATQYLSDMNLLGKSKFSAVYKGVLRDGSDVAIRSISITSCKSEETEFVRGLDLLFSMRHDNLVKLRGFCCSRSRNECFLVYDFAPKGKLSQFLDQQENSDKVLDWSKRVFIITGIAQGIQYLHKTEPNKPSIVHQNISTEKILLDQQDNPLISDSGLPKLLADDIVFSALKTSAAMGYLAPEYITTGRFTQKSDVYAFGVIVLQVVSGQLVLNNSIRTGAKTSKFEDFVDANLRGDFSQSEAAKLGKLALACTNEVPEERPSAEEIIQQLRKD